MHRLRVPAARPRAQPPVLQCAAHARARARVHALQPGKGSFYATDLDLVLRTAGIANLVLAGITTDVRAVHAACCACSARACAARAVLCRTGARDA